MGNVPGCKVGYRFQSAAAGHPAATSLWWEVWEVLEAGSRSEGDGAGSQRAGPLAAPFPGVGNPQPQGLLGDPDSPLCPPDPKCPSTRRPSEPTLVFTSP